MHRTIDDNDWPVTSDNNQRNKSKSNCAQTDTRKKKECSFCSLHWALLSAPQRHHLQFEMRLQSYQIGKSLYKNDSTVNRFRSFCISFSAGDFSFHTASLPLLIRSGRIFCHTHIRSARFLHSAFLYKRAKKKTKNNHHNDTWTKYHLKHGWEAATANYREDD